MRHPRAKGVKHRDDDPWPIIKSFFALELLLLPSGQALALLLASRLISALFNIVHDCDEVYNYWEPLHYLVYGHGMQTWEYSSKYALRSWLYVVLHALVAAPASWVLGSAAGKVVVFYLTKAALGLLSVWSEWQLYKAVRQRYSHFVSNAFIVMLCTSSGMFAASTALLPSSFAMYALTGAAAGVIQGQYKTTILCAVIGVTLGWCVAGVAFLPYALWVLLYCPFVPSVVTAVLGLVGVTVPLVLVDRLFYGKWTASLWNFLVYNVAGGGQSALYGVEGPTYYLRNGLNQLQLVMPLALLLPGTASIRYVAWRQGLQGQSRSKVKGMRPPVDGPLVWAVAPAAVWLLAITSLPHKEERFLYVVYPLLCLGAAASLHCIAHTAASIFTVITGSHVGRVLARLAAFTALILTCLLSLSRSAALVSHYGAPMNIYTHLPALPASGTNTTVSVCVGAEWHRFPSSFFLPGPQYRLQFIKSGFTGLLPRPFDDAQGGSKAAPVQLNDGNVEEPANYWSSTERCDYVVTLDDQGALIDDLVQDKGWHTWVQLPFVDNARSPALSRALLLPWGDENYIMKYTLLSREPFVEQQRNRIEL